MASAPPPPPGFELDRAPSRGLAGRITVAPKPAPRLPGSMAVMADDAPPPPPPGFELDVSGSVTDGDTFGLADGRNARLFGTDAFESDQGGLVAGKPVPLGAQSRDFLRSRVLPGSKAVATGEQTYGRPVASLVTGGADVARQSIEAGMSLPTPRYLADDPKRLSDYVEAQRDAIAAERGAYAGQYQIPEQYRRMGEDAPWQGKAAMAPDEYREFSALLRNPKTTPRQLEAWAAGRGRRLTNAGNLLAFMRDNPGATISGDWQQADVTGEPVLRDGPGFATRQLGALNEGIADVLGFPVDAINAGLGFVGVPVSDTPFLGSESIRQGMRSLGMGQVDDSYAPRSDFERYSQNIARGLGQAVVPIGGQLAAGGRLALRAAPALAAEGSATRSALSNALREGARNPGLLVAGELGAGAGSGVGGQVADDIAPGNLYAQMAGQVIGGLGGGIGAGAAASRRGMAARLSPPPAPDASLPPMAPLTPEELAGALSVDVSEAPSTAAPLYLSASMELPPKAPRSISELSAVERAKLNADIEKSQEPFIYENGDWRNETPQERAARYAEIDGRLEADLASIRPTGADTVALPDETAAPSISAPARPDEADIAQAPEPPAGFVLDQPNVASEPPLSHRPRPILQRPSPEEMARAAETIQPGDVTPIPSNMIEGPEELARIGEGMRPELRAPNERDALPAYSVNGRTRRNPLDLVSWLRTQGGIREQGGELRAIGVDNKPRDLDFARDEGMLGRLVNESGMTLDEAARAAWEAGYFPDSPERPTVPEFLDALRATYMGGSGRVFRPDDYGAIDDFYRAQGERLRVESARETGTPLYDDLGQPIGPDDLKAMEPPAVAYEDLPKTGGKVANVNLANLETSGDISRLLQATETRFGGFDAARRGRITQAETEALASELGMTVDDLLKRRQGQALNAEQALAARQLLAKSSDELLKLAERAKGGSDDDLLAFRQAMLRHAAIYEQVTAATAEAGRALAAFKIVGKSSAVRAKLHKAMIEASGGRDDLEKVAAELILNAEKDGMTPGGVTRFVVDATKPRFKDKLIELWYNSLLSSPQTHIVNITSNAMTSALQLPEQATAAALGLLRGKSGDRVLLSEIGPRAVGLLQGAREGLAQFGSTLRTGNTTDPLTKVEAQSERAISGLKGEIIRTPSRALAAEDELFKAVARRMEINGLAVRKAKAEGLKGDALRARIAELAANPTDDMTEAAFDYARYLTFQSPVGPLAGPVMQLTKGLPALKLVLPFIRTPSNIIKFAVERSPAAPILREVRDDLKAGGAKRDLAAAQIMLGTGLGYLVAQYAAAGMISGGGPADESAKRLLIADGWQPYSIRVGDRWISYSRFDPLSTTIGIVADAVEKQDYMTEKQREQTGALVLASIIGNLSDKTWLSGVSDMVAAIDDPQRNAGRFVGRIAGSAAVPAVVAQVARASDPVMREVRGDGVLDSAAATIQSRVPGLSTQLEPRRDVFGDVRRRENLGPDYLSPISTSDAKNDPIARELLDLGVRLSPPGRTLKIAGTDRPYEMTPKEYSSYAALAGKNLLEGLQSLVDDPEYRTLSPAERRYEIDQVKRDSRAAARAAIFGDRFNDDGETTLAPPPGYTADSGLAKRSASPALRGLPADMRGRLAVEGIAPPPAPPPGFVVDKAPPGFVLDRKAR